VTVSRDLTGSQMQSRPRGDFSFEEAPAYVWHPKSWPHFAEHEIRETASGESGERSLAAFHPFVVFEYVSDDMILG